MNFHLNHDPANKTLTIPRAALQLSGLADVSDLILHTDSGCILLLPGRSYRSGTAENHFSHLRRCTAADLPSGGEKPVGDGDWHGGNGVRRL